MFVPAVCVPARSNVRDCNRTRKGGEESRPFLLYDKRAFELGELLQSYGTPVPLPPFKKLPAPVCGHPDLLVFQNRDTLYTYKEYFLENRQLFASLPVKTVSLDLDVGAYPNDVWFDHLPMGKYLLGREDRMPETIKKLFIPVNVKQGYARCSALRIGERALVTADRGIASASDALGMCVLQITEGHIFLPGYSYGFIGGAAGNVGNKILFFGSLSSHPQGREIRETVLSQGFFPVELTLGPLTDYGGVIAVF